MFRITVALVLLSARDLYTIPQWAALPNAVRVTPGGLGGLLAQLPMNAPIARMGLAAMVLCLLAGLVGWWTRTAFLIATLLGVYLLGIPQLAGTTLHYHHLIWFTALLAASPCGDAWSVDEWIARRCGDGHSREPVAAYGVPIRAAWLLLGIVFFFPGLWKLRTSGLAWILSDNLRNQMYWKWAQTGHVPLLRVDRLPWLCHLGALGVVAFELSFPVLIFIRRTRPWAVVSALLFHASAAIWMDLHYSVLWCCYTVFVDWSFLSRDDRASAERTAPVAPSRWSWPPAIVGSALIAGAAWAGCTGDVSSWPFACYPTFQWTAGATMPGLQIEVTGEDGARRVVPDTALVRVEGATHHWGLVWSLIGRPSDPSRLMSYWQSIRDLPSLGSMARHARTVRFYRVWRSVVPEDRDRPPVSRELLYEWDPALRSPETSKPRARSGSTTRASSEDAASAR